MFDINSLLNGNVALMALGVGTWDKLPFPVKCSLVMLISCKLIVANVGIRFILEKLGAVYKLRRREYDEQMVHDFVGKSSENSFMPDGGVHFGSSEAEKIYDNILKDISKRGSKMRKINLFPSCTYISAFSSIADPRPIVFAKVVHNGKTLNLLMMISHEPTYVELYVQSLMEWDVEHVSSYVKSLVEEPSSVPETSVSDNLEVKVDCNIYTISTYRDNPSFVKNGAILEGSVTEEFMGIDIGIVKRHMDSFLSVPRRHREMLTFFVHGVPGTGKTSFAKYMALEYNRDIIQADLRRIGDKTRLLSVLNLMPRPDRDQIILLDDIRGCDYSCESVEKKEKDPWNIPIKLKTTECVTSSRVGGGMVKALVSKKDIPSQNGNEDYSISKDGISLRDLQSVFGGVCGKSNLIVVISTNYPEEISPILRRPGRMVNLEFGPLSQERVNEILQKKFGTDPSSETGPMTPALLREALKCSNTYDEFWKYLEVHNQSYDEF